MPTLTMTLVCAQAYSEVLDDAPVIPACLVEAQTAVAMLRHWQFVSVESVACRPHLHDGAPAWHIALTLQAPQRFARRGRHDGSNVTELEGSLCSSLLEIFSSFQVMSCTLTSDPSKPSDSSDSRVPVARRRRAPRFND